MDNVLDTDMLPKGVSEHTVSFSIADADGDFPLDGFIAIQWNEGEPPVTTKLQAVIGADPLWFSAWTVGRGALLAGLYAFWSWKKSKRAQGKPTESYLVTDEKAWTFDGWGKRVAALAGTGGILGALLGGDFLGSTIGGVEKGLFVAVQAVLVALLLMDDFVYGAMEAKNISFLDENDEDRREVKEKWTVEYWHVPSKEAKAIQDTGLVTAPAPMTLEYAEQSFSGDAGTLAGFILGSSFTVWALFGEMALLVLTIGFGMENVGLLIGAGVLLLTALYFVGRYLIRGANATIKRALTLAQANDKKLDELEKRFEKEAKPLRAAAYAKAIPKPKGPNGDKPKDCKGGDKPKDCKEGDKPKDCKGLEDDDKSDNGGDPPEPPTEHEMVIDAEISSAAAWIRSMAAGVPEPSTVLERPIRP